jgi:hypothetical protein
MKLARLIFVAAYLLACAIVAPFGVAAGQSRTLVAPDEIVLYLHAQIKNTDFVEPLVCLLRRVLVGSVESQSLKLSLSNEALASPSQFDVTKVATQFSRATAGEGTSRTFKYFLMPFDMKDAQYRYLFASSFSGHVGVISLARLEVIEPRLSRRERAEATALRVYKLILGLQGIEWAVLGIIAAEACK